MATSNLTVSNLLATLALCCTLLGTGYGIIIAPLQAEVSRLQEQQKTFIQTDVKVDTNTITLEKHDVRIEQNGKRIQLAEINAAKREVQMKHLTDAILELNDILKTMKENKDG